MTIINRRSFIKKSLFAAGRLMVTATGISTAKALLNSDKGMKIIAINGSPRKNGNTATMCKHFLKGATSTEQNVQTSLVNLRDYDFKGCVSCFACKRKNSTAYGKCTYKDGISELLEGVSSADGIVFGSPIYLGYFSSCMHCFLERLLFPFITYEKEAKTIAPKRFQTAMIYTMNASQERSKEIGQENFPKRMESYIERVFTAPEIISAYNTYQFDDYNLFESAMFDEQNKAIHREKQFPIDCQNAFNAGKTMVEKIKNVRK
jgi:multimeric flavodoxin WrbA